MHVRTSNCYGNYGILSQLQAGVGALSFCASPAWHCGSATPASHRWSAGYLCLRRGLNLRQNLSSAIARSLGVDCVFGLLVLGPWICLARLDSDVGTWLVGGVYPTNLLHLMLRLPDSRCLSGIKLRFFQPRCPSWVPPWTLTVYYLYLFFLATQYLAEFKPKLIPCVCVCVWGNVALIRVSKANVLDHCPWKWRRSLLL